jgi:AhpD family alkylhydroperoxidase
MSTAAVMPAMPTEWSECLLPRAEMPPALAREVRALVGSDPGFAPRLAHAPWVVRAIARLIDGSPAYLNVPVDERIMLVVAQENSCRYCYGMHRALLRIAGHSERDVDRIVRDSLVADLSPGERVAVDYARRVARCSPRPGRAELGVVEAAGLERRAAVEAAAMAAFGSFVNRIATLAALPPEPLEALTQAPYFRFIRPLLALGFRRRERPPKPVPEPRDPCARVVAALGDAPSAHVLRAIIDDAIASPILPGRTKALIMVVVARALDCRYGEAEARALLAREGFAASDVDEVLATLSSPRLDAREARLVPFARETIRYQPAVIQARIREVCRDLGPAETTEAIGVIALANAVCRLSVVLDA